MAVWQKPPSRLTHSSALSHHSETVSEQGVLAPTIPVSVIAMARRAFAIVAKGSMLGPLTCVTSQGYLNHHGQMSEDYCATEGRQTSFGVQCLIQTMPVSLVEPGWG